MNRFKEVNRHIQRFIHISNKAKVNLPHSSGRRINRKHLPILFKELGYNLGVEVGVRRGGYTKCLLDANPELKMFCVDPWGSYNDGRYTEEVQEGIYQECHKNLEGYNVEFVRKPSLDAVRDFENETFDFVYIDGDHRFDGVMQDLIKWYPKVKKNGIIALHDVYHGETGVLKAVEAFTHCHKVDPWYITKEDQPTAYWVKP